jgi:hypothetical protein
MTEECEFLGSGEAEDDGALSILLYRAVQTADLLEAEYWS